MGGIAALLSQFSPHVFPKLPRQPGRRFRGDTFIQFHIMDNDLRATAAKPGARQPKHGSDSRGEDEHGDNPASDHAGYGSQN
jgi:hypothetical protein